MSYIFCVYIVEFREEVRELCSEVNPEQITQLCDFLTEAGLNRDNPKLLKTDLESLIHIINDQGYDWIAIKNLLGQIAKASLSSNDYNALEACYQDCMSSNSNLEYLINLIKTEFSGFQSTLQRLHQKAENNIKDLNLIAGGTNSGKTNASNSWIPNQNRTGKQKAKAIGIDVGEVLLLGSIVNSNFTQAKETITARQMAKLQSYKGDEEFYGHKFSPNAEFIGGEVRAVKRLGIIPDLSYRLSFGNRLKYIATKYLPGGFFYRVYRARKTTEEADKLFKKAMEVDKSFVSSFSNHTSITPKEIIQDDVEKLSANVESSDINIRRFSHKIENTDMFNKLDNLRINHKSAGKLPRLSDLLPKGWRIEDPEEIKVLANGSDVVKNFEQKSEKELLNVLNDDLIAMKKAEGNIISDLEE